MADQKKYKVIQLLEWFELGGGLESITGEIALGLDRDQFDVEIWCVARGGKLVDVFRKKGVVVRVLDIKSYFDLRNIFKLASLLKEAKVDVIHAHVYFASTIGRMAAKMAGVKVIVHHVHSTYWHYSLMNIMIERILAVWTYQIICVSQAVKRFVVEYEKINSRRVVVVHNGVTKQEVGNCQDVRKNLGLTSSDAVVVCVASLLENKGHKILIEAINLLKTRQVQCRCLIVGEGPTEQALKEQVKACGLEQWVCFLGVRTDVPQILTACDVFVLPSIEREGLPVSILEAMAYGVPVIASRVGGVAEVITDKESGLLLAPADAQVLADAMALLFNDPQLRQRLVQKAGQRFAEHFDSKSMIRSIEKIYLDGLRGKEIAG